MPRWSTLAAHVAGLAALAMLMGGCSSIGKGVAKAVMEKANEKPSPDSSMCEVAGPEFPGLAAGLKGAAPDQHKTARLIVVHGIGEHEPGYSLRLQYNIAGRLGLDGIDPTVKIIKLRNPPDSKVGAPGASLGTLRISRYSNGKGAELLAFEVTWSDLFTEERRATLFDDYGLHVGARADINSSLKKLINSFTEPLAYHGPKGELARATMMQSFCWAVRSDWSGYPISAQEACSLNEIKSDIIARDAIAISTHSLGSRIAIDSLMALSRVRESYANDPKARSGYQAMQLLRDKDITFFMLANQLPLLQVGQAPPDVVGKMPLYCGPGASNVRDRLFKSLSIVAFSDPNDVLSYRIPENFITEHLDSRLCASVTNVSIAVASEVSLPGASFASPELAHTNYEDDTRVLALMAGGLEAGGPPQSCTWLRSRAN